jgi:protein phosphatase
MKLRITAVSDKGCVRENNEDMVLVGKKLIRDNRLQGAVEPGEDNPIFIVAVADGMGGANAGEVASQLVLEMVREGIYGLEVGLDDEGIKAAIKSLCLETHQRVLHEGMADPAKRGMGSTLVGMFYYEGRLFLINAGDSRLYRFRNGILMQISRDHSLRELSGNSEAPSNVIVNSFGGGKAFYVDIEIASKKVLEGDIFLLCSDGVSDLLNDEEIEEELAKDGFEDSLLEASKNKGGRDNISYVLVEVSYVEVEKTCQQDSATDEQLSTP